ncbi:MAG: hypothetical protein ACREDE_09820, partial [Thermoplasmata archaeon]
PFVNPQAGNIETLTVFANQSAHSGPLAYIQLVVYYATTGNPAGALPSCGAAWVSGISCPGGSTIGSTVVGNGIEGTFHFDVNPPPGTTGIWVEAFSESTSQQASNSTFLWVSVTPSNCVTGEAGCPSANGENTWALLGPILLSIAFVLAGVLVAVNVSLWWIRVVAIALPVGVVALLYLAGLYAAAFSQGGLFFPG